MIYKISFFTFVFVCIVLPSSAQQAIYSRAAIGQIRLNLPKTTNNTNTPIPVSSTTTIPSSTNVSTPLATNPPTVVVSPNTSGPNPVVVDQLDLLLKLMPYKVGDINILSIVFDETKALSASNPVRIINRRDNGYFSFYPDSSGYFRLNIGRIPDEKMSLLQLTNSSSNNDFKNSVFTDSRNISFVSEEANLQQVVIGKQQNIELDVMPRARTRYTTVTAPFEVWGMTIPAGYIVAGIHETGIKPARPGFAEFQNFRVYRPEDGALITIFNQNDVSKLKCSQGAAYACISFPKYYTEENTKDDIGAKISSSFSTKDLFTKHDVSTANLLWLRIQQDLASKTQHNINLRNEAWASKILDALSEDHMIYLSHVLTTSTKSQVLSLLGFDETIIHKDSEAARLYQAQYLALQELAQAKVDLWRSPRNNAFVSVVSQKENTYKQARQVYLDYLQNKTPPKTTTTKTSTDQSTSTPAKNPTTTTASNSTSTPINKPTPPPPANKPMTQAQAKAILRKAINR